MTVQLYNWSKQSVWSTSLNISMNGPSKVCALSTIKSKVYTDPIGVENGLWPLRCPQRNLEFFYNEDNFSQIWDSAHKIRRLYFTKQNLTLKKSVHRDICKFLKITTKAHLLHFRLFLDQFQLWYFIQDNFCHKAPVIFVYVMMFLYVQCCTLIPFHVTLWHIYFPHLLILLVTFHVSSPQWGKQWNI